jgi:putative transcriptional regulator
MVPMRASRIRQMRQRLGLTQKAFAKMFHLNLGALRAWEQGRRKATGPVCTLLATIEAEPDMVARILARKGRR